METSESRAHDDDDDDDDGGGGGDDDDDDDKMFSWCYMVIYLYL